MLFFKGSRSLPNCCLFFRWIIEHLQGFALICYLKNQKVVFKANWNPKSQNLMETAQELALLPESFVFVDDNPAEREIIKEASIEDVG